MRRSNHFGIAGYYAMMAMEHDCIGIASTNAGRLAAPTGGREPMLGTNPFAYALPGEDGDSFVLDMATTTVALGKLEIAKRLGKSMPEGWAVDKDGNSTTDPEAGMLGALLPLGGFGTETGGHKGFGLAVLADMLCGVLGGGVFTPDMPSQRNILDPGIVSNFFMAIRIDNFRDPKEFRRDVSRSLRAFRESAPAPGFDRIYTAGEPEKIRTEEHLTQRHRPRSRRRRQPEQRRAETRHRAARTDRRTLMADQKPRTAEINGALWGARVLDWAEIRMPQARSKAGESRRKGFTARVGTA